MYLHICKHDPPHFSHSAAEHPNDPSCPVCGEETRVVLSSTETTSGRLAEGHKLNELQLFELASDLQQRGYTESTIAFVLRLDVADLRMLKNRTTHDIGKAARLRAANLKDAGKSNLEIARELGISENAVRIIFGQRLSVDDKSEES